MKKNELKARIRQLMAIDMNAEAVYTELASLAPDDHLRNDFLKIAADERHHVAYSKAMLAQLKDLS